MYKKFKGLNITYVKFQNIKKLIRCLLPAGAMFTQRTWQCIIFGILFQVNIKKRINSKI